MDCFSSHFLYFTFFLSFIGLFLVFYLLKPINECTALLMFETSWFSIFFMKCFWEITISNWVVASSKSIFILCTETILNIIIIIESTTQYIAINEIINLIVHRVNIKSQCVCSLTCYKIVSVTPCERIRFYDFKARTIR